MSNPQVHTISRRQQPVSAGVGPAAPGVTAYVVDAPEILAGDHPLMGAIAELGATANQFAADTQVLVVVQKVTGNTRPAR